MIMEEKTEGQRPLRLVGFCKTCRRPGFGYLLYGVGPFICQNCANELANGVSPSTTTGSYRVTYTTSNSTTTDITDPNYPGRYS